MAARLRSATKEGVPTDIDCDVTFSEHQVLTFHCSFKHHLRQWVEAVSSSGRRVFCDDFVIPRREEVVDYTVEEIPDEHTMEYDTVVRGAKTTIPVLGCNQEVEMWNAFAALVAQGKGRRSPFEEAVLLTHAIIDALMESARGGGKLVLLGD